MLLVVAYDVSDDRRRARLRKVLLGYGVAVQESVVECEVTPVQTRALKEAAGREIDPAADRVAYYPLCTGCARKIRDGRGRRRRGLPLVAVV